MDICKIDQMNRNEIDDFIICQWFSLQMVLHGKSIDLGAADGWYAVQDNEIVGLITYRILDDRMEILSLDSLREQHGVGTALLNMAISYARNDGISKITLITTNDNLPALRFYQKRGFDMARLFCNVVDLSRKLKPEIPLFGIDGIPLKHEIELEMDI